ncbi:Hypp5374 [Branchiostoma lanceolatum]|uniref:Hypp5374 protein n=1 Tax=Branchiostoma lanceolatum TaxID=7740 RepID=A0A8K0AHH9_BRALA|nr:Hypp5374 [Branchiostoma lanceolatum]
MATRRSKRNYTTKEVLDKLFVDSDDETDNLQELNGTVCESDGEFDADDLAPSTAATELPDDDDNTLPEDDDLPGERFKLSCKKSKVLTSQNLVKSLEASLKDSDFDAVDVPDQEKTFMSYLEKPKRKIDPGKKIVCIPALHISLGLFHKFFRLLEHDLCDLDIVMGTYLSSAFLDDPDVDSGETLLDPDLHTLGKYIESVEEASCLERDLVLASQSRGKKLRGTRHLCRWLDYSTLLNTSNLLVTVHVLYDPAIFYTPHELEQQWRGMINVQGLVETPEVYLLAKSKSSIAEQLQILFSECQQQDLQSLSDTQVYEDLNMDNIIRFFTEDGPARWIES